MLLEEGKVALDDPVHRYIPGFENLRVFTGGDLASGFLTASSARPMKIIDLMRHTSGLTYGFSNRTNVDAAYTKLGVAEFYTEGGLAAMIAQLEKLPLGILVGGRLELIPSPPTSWAIWWKRSPAKISPISCAAGFLSPWACATPISTCPPKSAGRFAQLLLRQGGPDAAL